MGYNFKQYYIDKTYKEDVSALFVLYQTNMQNRQNAYA